MPPFFLTSVTQPFLPSSMSISDHLPIHDTTLLITHPFLDTLHLLPSITLPSVVPSLITSHPPPLITLPSAFPSLINQHLLLYPTLPPNLHPSPEDLRMNSVLTSNAADSSPSTGTLSQVNIVEQPNSLDHAPPHKGLSPGAVKLQK